MTQDLGRALTVELGSGWSCIDSLVDYCYRVPHDGRIARRGRSVGRAWDRHGLNPFMGGYESFDGRDVLFVRNSHHHKKRR